MHARHHHAHAEMHHRHMSARHEMHQRHETEVAEAEPEEGAGGPPAQQAA
jgi:hypothetical protein